jgi:glycine dehydrogenase subunit 1
LHNAHGIVGGYDLARVDPNRRHEMLVAVTEMNTREDIDCFVDAVRAVVAKH